MSEQEPAPFNFWWPTSQAGEKVMLCLLGMIGVLMFIKGCIDEELGEQFDGGYDNPGETIIEILFFYVALNMVGWYFIFNIGRFVYSRISRSETVQAMQETRREKAELDALRRRSEIKKLKEELGDDNGET